MRKIIQIATMPSSVSAYHSGIPAALYVLCDDGSLWVMGERAPWKQMKGPPLDDDPK